jgi:REP element-mobilizing transposase RayT
MHRGARRAPVFRNDAHCLLFLDLVESMVDDFDVEVHAYSLMPNHYHMLLRSPHGNLSRAMRQLQAEYTRRANAIEKWDGPIFRGRFHSQLVEDESSLPYVMAYIHLNPLRANLVTRLHAHAWTSHRTYLGRDTRPSWLTTSHFEAVFDDPDALHAYVLDLHRGKRSWPERMAMDSGWLAQAGERAARETRVAARTRFMEADEALARIREITGATMLELLRSERGPRANPERRFAVWALKRSTLLTHREIGTALGMSPQQAAQVIRKLRTREEPMKTWILQW